MAVPSKFWCTGPWGRLVRWGLVSLGSTALIRAQSTELLVSGDAWVTVMPAAQYAGWETVGAAFEQGPYPAGRAAPLAASNVKQSNGKSAYGSVFSPKFRVTHDFLNLRLGGGNHAFRSAASLWVDGRVVRTSTGGGREELRWVTWDLREFGGRVVQLGLHDYCIEDELPYIVLDRWEQSDQARGSVSGDVSAAQTAVKEEAVAAIRRHAGRAAADPQRPIYHYAPPAQRMNDPNGPAWHGGYHHVFYQHMVFVGHGPAINVHWGHARSRDLVNWETLPLAVHPAYAHGELSCFSGNLAWDFRGDPVQFVTSVPYRPHTPRRIWPARPLDDEWIEWARVPGQPLEQLQPTGDPADRDLKDAFPFSVGARRFLVLTDQDIPVFEAMDERLTQWERRAAIDPESAECPNFFEVDGRWIYLSSPHQPVRYRVGDFDPDTARFAMKTEGRLNHDRAFYASTAYRDNLGRTILLGVNRGQPDGRGWTGVLAMPRVLSLGPDDRPRMHPVPELQALRRDHFALETSWKLEDEERGVIGLQGDAMEIVARFRVNNAKSFGLKVRRSNEGGRALPVRWTEGEFEVVRPTPEFPCRYEIDPETQEVVFHLFLDKGVLDFCTDDGRVFESRIHQAPGADLGVAVFAEGGEVSLVSLEAWRMDPAVIDHAKLFESR